MGISAEWGRKMSKYDDEIALDYKNEQAYFNSLSIIPPAKDGLVPRFFKGSDCPDEYTCDVVYIDRLTGREVLRYDGADPANTRFDYGAQADRDILARKGLDIKEMIRPEQAVISLDQCRNAMRVDYSDPEWY